MAFDGGRPDGYAHFEKVLDFPSGLDLPPRPHVARPRPAGPDVDLAATGATGAVTGSATLTVTAAPSAQINLEATGSTGAVTGTATLTVTAAGPVLVLSDFDDAGLEVDAAAL